LLYVKENISILYVLLCIIIQLATTIYFIYIDKCKYNITQNNFEVVKNLFNSLTINIRRLPTNTFKNRIRSALTDNPLYKVSDFFKFKLDTWLIFMIHLHCYTYLMCPAKTFKKYYIRIIIRSFSSVLY
ncbi:hypothetical protein C0J52_09612, partial [Blattella germanica]